MVQVQLPNSVERILKICLLLICIGSFIVIVIGIALINAQTESKKTEKFLEVGSTIHKDFESSLMMYTEKARNTIDFLFSLRPRNEEDVIKFISEIEKIGQESSLNLQLSTYGEVMKTKSKKKNKGAEYISYQILFFGSTDDLNKFLGRLEAIPYFIKVESITYQDLTTIEKTENTMPNINIIIQLYTKK